jgi:hypothetical protein
MIDRNNLPEWLIEKPGQHFAIGFVDCAIRASAMELSIPTIVPKEQQGLK